ncbi:MAG: 50S ribosomal protein L32 [Rickettsiales bacterium]|jgi:large subunit ribosomal protein L32|nr:50S ribosomal protein L32 [Rickettsiales bacterium]
MAVPKKKTSPSKKGMRRGGNGTYRIKVPNIVTNSETGEYQLQHHISSDGYYKKRKVIKDKPKKEDGGKTQE